MAFNFFLPFNIKTEQDDTVIASPVYAVEALFSEHRKLSPTKFFRRVILVDAVNGASQVTKLVRMPAPVLLEEGLEHYFLEPKITSNTARFIAEKATAPYEERSFGTLLMNWKIYPKYNEVKQLYQGFIIRGNSFIDAFNAYSIESERICALHKALRNMHS